MTVPERLDALSALMKEKNIAAYLVPTDDFHSSEYVGDYFKCRKFITGFTGSAGTAVITEKEAGLWTDGRYFLQAASQLQGSGITLYRMGESGVPSIREYLEKVLSEGQTLAFDGRCVSAKEGTELEKLLQKKKVSISYGEDLIDRIWEDRPALSCQPVWLLDTAYAGSDRKEKISLIRETLTKVGASHYLLSSLDDIAWLLNVRGNDVAYNPVVLSYIEMTMESVTWFVQEEALNETLRSELEKDGITIKPYHSFYEHASSIPAGSRILIDPDSSNYALFRSLSVGCTLLKAENPTLLPKAVKNKTEVENIRLAHIKDGVAVTRFIYWLKHSVDREKITEISAAEKLESFRKMGEHYLGQSFDPIIAYGEHGSIIHYSATPETDVPVKSGAMLLCDTGGQYLEGTTDITRTVVLGEVSHEIKEMFTRVLRGNLNLSGAHFREGAPGLLLDYLAREPLWEIGLDYRHGTGHGVGYCLNVHEGPNSFHWKTGSGRKAQTPLQEGMLTSNEPGYYKDNAYGIRHENLMLTVKAEETEYGQFMAFDTVTLVPFDLDGILPELMTSKERELLNAYHQKVYDTISPFLTDEERDWLKEVTRAI